MTYPDGETLHILVCNEPGNFRLFGYPHHGAHQNIGGFVTLESDVVGACGEWHS